jgi:hypothetical protein
VTAGRLGELGVQTLVILATGMDRARLYFRFRPPRCEVVVDPELITHRAYGVPQTERMPEFLRINRSNYAELARQENLQVPAAEAYDALNRLDGFTLTEDDAAERARHKVQFTGHFLVDRDGVVRWLTIEGSQEGLAGLGKFPTDEELLSAARLLPR